MKLERKSERQYVPKVTPTALAKVGAVAERDMFCFELGFYLLIVVGGSVCDESCAKDPKSLDPCLSCRTFVCGS